MLRKVIRYVISSCPFPCLKRAFINHTLMCYFQKCIQKLALLIHHFVIRKQLEEEQSLPRDGHFIQSEKWYVMWTVPIFFQIKEGVIHITNWFVIGLNIWRKWTKIYHFGESLTYQIRRCDWPRITFIINQRVNNYQKNYLTCRKGK